MLGNIRVSLWDVFTFFLSGFLAAVIALGHLMFLGHISVAQVKEFLFSMPATLALFLLPVFFVALGTVMEPLANYFDKFVMNRVIQLLPKKSNDNQRQEELIEDFIKSNCLGELSGKIESPYFLCRDYVEAKQLSATFMPFLSRFGLYRNLAFFTFISAILAIFIMPTWPASAAGVLLWLLASIVFKKRADDFYSYQAPAIYHAFLIDKLAWTSPLSKERNRSETHG